MAVSGRALDAEARKARAERILDSAAELLLRWGYKRVTIDDVAENAGIGKGTIYLHWPTREALFSTVLHREMVAAIGQLTAALDKEPSLALLHRLLPFWFVTVKSRPLVRAAILSELDVLGKLSKGVDQAIECELAAAFRDYVELHVERGLVRADVAANDLVYALRATVRGFFLADILGPPEAQLALERRAELLGAILASGFMRQNEMRGEDARALAANVRGIFERMAERFTTQLRQAYEH